MTRSLACSNALMKRCAFGYPASLTFSFIAFECLSLDAPAFPILLFSRFRSLALKIPDVENNLLVFLVAVDVLVALKAHFFMQSDAGEIVCAHLIEHDPVSLARR